MPDLGLGEILVWIVSVAMYVLIPVAVIVITLRVLGYGRRSRLDR